MTEESVAPPRDPAVTEREIALETAPAKQRSDAGLKVGLNAHVRARIPSTLRLLFGDTPSLWAETPATPAQVLRYARDGAWCPADSVAWRTAGWIYAAVIAVPITVALYLLTWIVQRPGRALFAGLLILLAWIFG